jgi:hypothetical protein
VSTSTTSRRKSGTRTGPSRCLKTASRTSARAAGRRRSAR